MEKLNDNLYKFIKKAIQKEDTMHISEEDYSSWFNFITDWKIHDEEDSEKLEELLKEKGEDHWERLWIESH